VQAQEIVRLNKFEDRIMVLKAKIEELKELPGPFKQVDIIVSEWMG